MSNKGVKMIKTISRNWTKLPYRVLYERWLWFFQSLRGDFMDNRTPVILAFRYGYDDTQAFIDTLWPPTVVKVEMFIARHRLDGLWPDDAKALRNAAKKIFGIYEE